ncbi:MAG: hypothetical protein ASARMPRED_003700 [Alectoria sarmentosa]|nr:MAG: hypothetical protein ASARMPRED_003700 [Alectoria sarmentosa]
MKTDKLAIRNPARNEYVQKVAAKAAEALGIKSDARAIKAELKGARLWTVGACLVPYRDIPYVVGCLGKLLIRLPAAHEGGDLLATYGGETKTFSTETSCFWGYSYFAWYSDVTLELKPLGSGYRLMLEYDLIVPSPAKRPRLAHLYKEKEKLRDVLTAWNDSVKKDEVTQKSNFPTLLAYICDSHYTSQSLNLNVLQGNDLLRAACLKDLCSQIGMGLYIANIDRTHSGFCNSHPSYYGEPDHHYIETTDDDFITWTKVVDLDGNTVAIDGSLESDENFIQSEPFEDIPDDEDFDRGHGLVTHSYRRTVLVLIPSVAKAEWLPEGSKESRPNKRKRSAEIIDLQ